MSKSSAATHHGDFERLLGIQQFAFLSLWQHQQQQQCTATIHSNKKQQTTNLFYCYY